ncbi:MAG: HIT family protein, partial [Flavobacteriales bacterium]|nr:HIT family protein [Flavobacteriales bacterium]
TLVIPKQEVDYFFDMTPEDLGAINQFAKGVAKKIEKAMPCKRIGITVIGLEVPHAHMHLIPINGVADMNFEKPKLSLSQDELASIAQRIRQA